MPRLPLPGSDEGTWGEILNDYLTVAHATDGTLRPGIVTPSALAANSVTPTKLAANTPASGHVLSYNGTSFEWITPTSGVTDHGLLSGLSDDDHPQYHTDTRGDARYYTQAQVDTSLSGKANTAHTHTATGISDSTETGRSVLTATDASAARTAIGAGTSNFDGAYGSLTGTPTLGTAAAQDVAAFVAAPEAAGEAGDVLTFTSGGNAPAWQAVGGSAAASVLAITLTQTNQAITLPETATDGVVTIILTQDATGNRTATWPTTVSWDDGTTPILAAGAGERDVVTLLRTDDDWLGFTSGRFAPVPTPPDTEVPTAPTGLTATAVSSTTIDLTWSAASDNVGVTGYEYRRDGGTLVSVGNVLAATVTGLTASTSYTFEVRALDAAGNVSAWSASVSATTQEVSADSEAPATPAGLTATAASTTTVDLAWSASTDNVGVTGYEYRRDSGTAVDVGSVLATTATGLTAATAYTFEVRAYDAAGNRSAWSAPASATTQTDSSGADIFDDFTAADTTTVNGRTTSTGSAVWVSPGANLLDAGNVEAKITNNRVETSTACANVAIAQADAEVSVDYTITIPEGGASRQVRIGFGSTGVSNSVIIWVHQLGSLTIENRNTNGTKNTVVLAASGMPLSGNLALRAVGNTYTAYVDGVQVGAAQTITTGVRTRAAFSTFLNTTTVDNFKVTYL